MSRSGADLALLLLSSFRLLVERATAELARRGHPDYRSTHDFAMRAIAAGADSASELGRRTSVTKQAAARTISVLEERGYVRREPDPADGRRMMITVTERGVEVMQVGEAIFEELRADWEGRVGVTALAEVEAVLTALVGANAIRADEPGWVAQELT